VSGSLESYLLLSGLLFGIGTFGFLARRNAISMLMAVELMLNAVNLTIIAFGAFVAKLHVEASVIALIVIAVALFNVDLAVTPELVRLKNTMVLAGLGASSFELYFYINYRTYIKVKTVHYAERREKFIRNMEKDFRSYVLRAERKAA